MDSSVVKSKGRSEKPILSKLLNPFSCSISFTLFTSIQSVSLRKKFDIHYQKMNIESTAESQFLRSLQHQF